MVLYLCISCFFFCLSAVEKTQTSRQKTNINGKRNDKRNGKAPKSKYDSFSVKTGLASFSSAALGNNILGMAPVFWAVQEV